VNEIAPLQPITVNLNAAAGQRRPHHPGHETVLMLHARAINVGEPQRTSRHAAGARIAAQQHLSGCLGSAIRRQRLQRCGLVHGGVADVSDNRICGGQDEPLDAGLPASLQEVLGDRHVRLVSGHRIVHRAQY
jgi:hypothetical protein